MRFSEPGIADEDNECIAATADLNLNLSHPGSPSSCSSDMGSDLSSNSLTLTVSSDSSESGDLRHEILPFDLNYEACQETEGLSIVESMPEIMSSPQSLGPNVRQQAPAEVVAPDSSEKEVEENNRCATNFECNICFDIAKEPVVTSCGHLFCWPCLYLWLHVHSNHKECPVCKGEVTEAIITPIYGRGCSRSDDENKDEENSASGLLIPWRPRGNRLESRRQNFDRISRFVGEGIANSWRLYQNYQMHDRSEFIGREDVLMDEILALDPSILTSSMTRRLEQGNTEDGPTTMEGRFQRDDESVLRDGGTESIPNEIDTGRGVYFISAIDNFVAMNSVIGRAAGRYTENTNFCGPSSSVNSPNPGQFVSLPIVRARPSVDQASASTAVAEEISECSARDVLIDEILAGDPAILTSSMTGRLEQGNTEDGPTTVEGRFQRDDESVLRDGATESIPNEIDIGRGVFLLPCIYNLVTMNSVIERAVGRYTENSSFCGTSSSVNSPNPGQFVSIPILGARPSADQASASTAVNEIVKECSARDASAETNNGRSSSPYRRIRGSSSSSSSDDGGNRWTHKRIRLH